MLIRFRSAMTFANVVSVVALFVALGGGAYALSKNGVKSRHIAKGAVKGSDVRSEALKSKHIRDGKVTAPDLADGSVASAAIADASVGGADLANGSVEGRHVVQSTLDELETGASVTELQGQPALGASDTDLITTSITVDEPKTVIALATIEAEMTGASPERVGCHFEISGVSSGDDFAQTIPVTGTADEETITVSFARTVSAGSHPVALVCRRIDGTTVFVEDGWLSAWAVG